jgi:glycosyltransferase involved in cell wall biosynthesis
MTQNVIIYLGFNSFKKHKRGVENVILFQSRSLSNTKKYYIYFDVIRSVYRWEDIVCIGVKYNVFRFISLNFLIRRLIRKNSTKRICLHSHHYLMSFFLTRWTDIFTVHDALYYQYKKKKRKYLFIFRFIEMMVYRKTKLVHFISEYAKSQALSKYLTKTEIIPNTCNFRISNVNISLENTTPLHDEYKKILIVRSIEERARIDLVLEVVENMQNEPILFDIVGKGPLLDHYKEMAKRRKLYNVVFHDYVSNDELVKFYLQTDIVMVPAEYGEGFGLPIIEGYFFNKPVIASNICAIPDVIIDKKYLFENRVADVRDKIAYALMKNNSINFREYYLNTFSFELISAKYQELYKDFISHK